MTYPGYGPPPPHWGAAPPQPRNGLGTAGLTLGIIALVFSFIPLIGVIAWPLAIVGLILGICGISRASKQIANNRGVAIGGVICSVFALVVCTVWVAGLSAASTARNNTPTAAAGSLSGVDQVPARAANPPAATAPEPTRADPTVIKVKKMGDDFEANQVAAEKKWGGQYVQFTAPVGNITSSSVSFTDATSKFSFTQVSCRFKDESAVLNLAKGKPATVRGIVGDDQFLGVISLDQCEIVG
jgi:hypothetical protein